MVVSLRRGIPIYNNPYSGDSLKGTCNFGEALRYTIYTYQSHKGRLEMAASVPFALSRVVRSSALTK